MAKARKPTKTKTVKTKKPPARTPATSRAAAPRVTARVRTSRRSVPDAAAEFVQGELAKLADPHKAVPMAAYMKTDMPFWGVQKPGRVPIARELVRRFPATSIVGYREIVSRLWELPHREEKYIAIDYALAHEEFIAFESLPLYEGLIRSGAWWDFVDTVAVHLVGTVYLAERERVAAVLDRWIEDDDRWIRRSALIAQIKHRNRTDAKRLFRYCRLRASETEFFIRKAIGWALREYSYHAPEAVARFLGKHRDELSGLSLREGAKQLRRVGLAPLLP